MVFGRRAVRTCIRPAPPGVDDILADLEATDSKDPVFTLSTDLLNGWLETTSTGTDISDPNILYSKVNEYINSKDKLENLEKEVLQGTQSLEKSLVDLKALAKEVQGNLEKVKNPGSVSQTVKEVSTEVVEDQKENVCDTAAKEDKEVEVTASVVDSSNSDQENLC